MPSQHLDKIDPSAGAIPAEEFSFSPDTHFLTHPFPATPTIWKCRAIYRVDDHQVGLWSLEVSVTVGG